MAAANYATGLTDIYVGGAGSFSALGGGAAGLNTETDYFIQGTDCKSKNAWNNAIKGLIHDNGSSFTVPTTGGIILWDTIPPWVLLKYRTLAEVLTTADSW